MKKRICAQCENALLKDDVGLSQKMFGQDMAAFYCVECLAAELDCDPDDLAIKIQEFKEQGCTLFLQEVIGWKR